MRDNTQNYILQMKLNLCINIKVDLTVKTIHCFFVFIQWNEITFYDKLYRFYQVDGILRNAPRKFVPSIVPYTVPAHAH